MKKTLLFLLLCLFLSSCGWFNEKPEIAIVLAKHFDNKLYNKFDTATYYPIFSKKMDELGNSLSNPKTTKAFYKSNHNNPVLTTRFFVNGGIDSLIDYLNKSKDDGINPEILKSNELYSLVAELKTNKFKSIDEVYPLIAEIEVKTADALLRYTNMMKYGIINPRNIFNRYYIKVKRPDSLTMDSLLNTTDIVASLKSAQPTSKNYKDLKAMLTLKRYCRSLSKRLVRMLIKSWPMCNLKPFLAAWKTPGQYFILRSRRGIKE